MSENTQHNFCCHICESEEYLVRKGYARDDASLVPLECTQCRLVQLIEVPSASDALLTLYQNEAFSTFTYWSCHLYLFTVQTLQNLAEKAGWKTVKMMQYQRYALFNHLYWLSEGKPGGQHVWQGMFGETLESEYAENLAKQGKCDTVIGIFTL